MASDQSETATPSTASRICQVKLEHAFPTPPRNPARTSSFRVHDRRTLGPDQMTFMKRASSTPPEHDSVPAYQQRLRANTGLPEASVLERSWQQADLSKKKSQYFEGAFAARDLNNTAKDRVSRDSIILAEVKLNCCLNSEQDFLIDLSFLLSEIYQRPASCIMVMVATQIQMLLAGASDPAYCLMITALPSEIAATKNKRSAHILQDFMMETLLISPRRGVVRFNAVAEENLATNGITALQEIEKLEAQTHTDHNALRTISRQTFRRSKKPVEILNSDPAPAPQSPINFKAPSTTKNNSEPDWKLNSAGTSFKRKLKNRKSIMAFFGRSVG